MTARFHGIYPILYAYFDADGRPLQAPIAAQVEAIVRHRAHGLAVLGLATETHKLVTAERRQILDWTAEALAGRLPLAVTIAEPSIAGQIAFAHAARDLGASWVILQPPAGGHGELEYIRFFGKVADAAGLPVALQNAAGYLGTGLSDAGLKTLIDQHPNVTLLKGEGPVEEIRRTIEATEGRLAVFNGRGGLEITDNLRAGCVGMVPAPECFDVQIRIYEAMKRGGPEGEAEAEALYRTILPLITFVMASIPAFLCYGKRLAARRLGFDPGHERSPSQLPSAFGMSVLDRLSAHLGPL